MLGHDANKLYMSMNVDDCAIGCTQSKKKKKSILNSPNLFTC